MVGCWWHVEVAVAANDGSAISEAGKTGDDSLLTVLAGLSLLTPAVFVGFPNLFSRSATAGIPIFYPMPALVFISMLFGLGFVGLAIPVAAFFLWNPGLFRSQTEVPARSYILLAVATLADASWFVAGWKLGLSFQGATYTYSVCAINVAWLTLLWLGFLLGRNARPSFRRNLVLHWMLFAWLAWSAFPFFGEML